MMAPVLNERGVPMAGEAVMFDTGSGRLSEKSERPEGEKFGTHSGLGLSISQQIVEAHNGTLTASNLRDSASRVIGARFTIDLPAI